jgi:two-component system alkaline phosphatase synthesis response regulator PhoP
MSSAARILVVEDELNVASTLTERLSAQGYAVTWARSAAEAIAQDLAAAKAGAAFDLALLDVGLPDQSGFEVAQAIRASHPRTAIVFLTAFGTPEDRVRGLELGAEDYIVKPFHFKELLLRIQNALRRATLLTSTESKFAGPLQVGRARIDLQRMEVTVEGLTAALTHKECAVLSLLLEKEGAVLTRDEILDRAWAQDEFPTPRTVDNFILRLRKLIEYDASEPSVIRSVRGVGYLLDTGAVSAAKD